MEHILTEGGLPVHPAFPPGQGSQTESSPDASGERAAKGAGGPGQILSCGTSRKK